MESVFSTPEKIVTNLRSDVNSKCENCNSILGKCFLNNYNNDNFSRIRNNLLNGGIQFTILLLDILEDDINYGNI